MEKRTYRSWQPKVIKHLVINLMINVQIYKTWNLKGDINKEKHSKLLYWKIKYYKDINFPQARPINLTESQ